MNFPKPAVGMLPNDRLAYSAISQRKPLKLPGKARMVVWVIVNIEEWDPRETMPRTVLTPPAGGAPLPDIPNWAWHEYGNRVGFWRLLEALDDHGIKAVLAINGKAVATYEAHVQPSVSAGVPINLVSDSASFLWRLQAYGHAVPAGLWEAASSYAEGFFQRPGFAFADVHMAIIAAATGDRAAVTQRVAALTGMVEAGTLPAGPVVPAVCRAALAFAEEDYAGCARILAPVAGEVVRIGGSGAQREMIEDMLLLALMRGGEAPKARELLDRRLHRRPSPRDTRWHALLAA